MATISSMPLPVRSSLSWLARVDHPAVLHQFPRLESPLDKEMHASPLTADTSSVAMANRVICLCGTCSSRSRQMEHCSRLLSCITDTGLVLLNSTRDTTCLLQQIKKSFSGRPPKR